MALVFNGKALAHKKEDILYHKVEKLKIKPVMATILVGDDPASRLYVNLKHAAAERVGIQMDIYEYPANIAKSTLIEKIEILSADRTISGIMVQLPLPPELRNSTSEIIDTIAANKDVDGLRDDSPYVHATARAVLSILSEAKKHIKVSADDYVVVVGANGMVGKSVVSELAKAGFEVGSSVSEAKNAKVLISATGKPGIISAEHVKKGAIVIDVGAPHGDVHFNEVEKKAGFITPVPGGVGPVTVISLLENLYEAAAGN